MDIKLALVDGNQQFLADFQEMIQEEFNKIGIKGCEIDCFSNAEEFLAHHMKDTYYTVLFTNLSLPNMDGIALAHQLRQHEQYLPIIFVSDSNEKAMETYDVNATYFLTKPIHEDDVHRVFKILCDLRKTQALPVTLPDGFHCKLSDVLYIRKQRQKCMVYLENQEVHVYPGTIDSMRYLFDAYPGFCEVDPETIVNLYRVESMNRTSILMANGNYIPISKRRVQEVNERYSSILIRCQMEG